MEIFSEQHLVAPSSLSILEEHDRLDFKHRGGCEEVP
jgi:hypothetical protein